MIVKIHFFSPQIGINMLKYAKAFKDNIIRKFTIKPVGYFILGSAQPNAQLNGELKNSHNGIVFKVNGTEQIVEKAMKLQLQLSNERFNICFTTNLNSFDIQHNAIQFMTLHKLYNILIKNDLYQMDIPLFEPSSDFDEFR